MIGVVPRAKPLSKQGSLALLLLSFLRLKLDYRLTLVALGVFLRGVVAVSLPNIGLVLTLWDHE